MTSSPRREWKSLVWVLKCSVRPLMRSVRSATCTSGEPVSLPERWYCFTTCAFCGTCNAIASLFRCLRSQIFEPAILTDAPSPSQGFSMFISRLCQPAGKPQRAQDAFGRGVAEADHGAVHPTQGPHPLAHVADFQRLAVAQADLRGRVELDARQSLQQRGERSKRRASLRRIAQLIERHGVAHAEAARAGPAQDGKVRHGPERGPDILGERADIGPLAHARADFQSVAFLRQ